MPLTKKEIQKYLKTSSHCPYCHSDNIEGRNTNIDEGGATQEVDCKDCGKHWHDVYDLVNIIEDED